MNLVKTNDPILTTVCDNFDFSNPPFDPIEFAQNLVRNMYEWNALGVAANQVGVSYRVFAMRGAPENFVCFNPKIVQPADQEVTLEESSITHPGLVVKVKRPQHIRVRFSTPNGDVRTETFTGMTARVFQQMYDQIDGVLYFNRASRYHRDIALDKWRKGKVSTIDVKLNTGLPQYEHLLYR